MGADKALLELGGRTLVEIALGTLREVCAEVAIAGTRPDLTHCGEVVPDLRSGCGPAAAIEACLAASRQPWAMFLPVDVPGVPAELLRRWASGVLDPALRPPPVASYLCAEGFPQPAFCLVRRELAAEIAASVAAGERRLMGLWRGLKAEHGGAAVLAVHAEELVPESAVEVPAWFRNLNTPEDVDRWKLRRV